MEDIFDILFKLEDTVRDKYKWKKIWDKDKKDWKQITNDILRSFYSLNQYVGFLMSDERIKTTTNKVSKLG